MAKFLTFHRAPKQRGAMGRVSAIKMIQRCAKHQKWAESGDHAAPNDEFTAYTTWGVAMGEQGTGPIMPGIAIKEVHMERIDRKIHPTRPVPLVPPEWYYTKNDGWKFWENPVNLIFDCFPPSGPRWFSLTPQNPESWNVERGEALTASALALREAERDAELRRTMIGFLCQMGVSETQAEEIVRRPEFRGATPQNVTISEA